MSRNALSLSLSRRRFYPRIVLLGVFLLCVCAGSIVGSYIKHQTGDANAASENITVTNNNQVSTMDQGTSQIVRTSTVTVKDTTATTGYILKARIENNSIPNSTVAIGSASSTTCTLASPCTITSDIAPTTILETDNNNAAQASGDITDWTVTVAMPSNTPQGNYMLDIAYSEEPIILLPTMQGFRVTDCAALTVGTTVQLRDRRDGKVYRVRKMADSRCWMVDNLAYDINTAPATGKPAYNPTAQLVSGTAASTYVRAQYVQNTADYNIPNNGNPTPSYLYNWCAAMGDASANCTTTINYAAGQPATPQTGICPAPFRLPMVGATPDPSTPGNGTNQAIAAATTTNEFAKLDIWLGGTGINRQSANTYTNFVTDDTISPQLFFSGVFSGRYINGLDAPGSAGYWWSSTVYTNSTYVYTLNVSSTFAIVYPSYYEQKGRGFAVRCVL